MDKTYSNCSERAFFLLLQFKDMFAFCDADTERAVGLLRRYQADLTSPEEQTLKNSVGKVSAILGSQLFQALLGTKRYLKLFVSYCGFHCKYVLRWNIFFSILLYLFQRKLYDHKNVKSWFISEICF